jgi:hypothetical protein
MSLEAEESKDGLVIDGQLFVRDDDNHDVARAVYTAMKGGALKEFSFAYEVRQARFVEEDGKEIRELVDLDVFEVGPTLVGMNPSTRLLEVAGMDPQKAALRAHETGTSDSSWDADAMRRRLPNSAPALRASHAWRDPDGDADTKGSYRFIHHFVSDAGAVGAASTVACSTGIGVLNGGRGGTTIPDSDRRGVWRHLASHLEDADREAPPLKSQANEEGNPQGQTESGEELEERTARVRSLLLAYPNH